MSNEKRPDPARSVFLRACRRAPTPYAPVWLMRQAGRYMPEYRAIKERHRSILEMIKDPAVAAEITLQPIRAFPLDAAIIFADILTILEPMGFQLEFVKGEGPVIRNPVRDPADLHRLLPVDPKAQLHFTIEAIRLVRRELGDRLPLIGFSGAPFTLACYAIEGGSSRDFARARLFMYSHPQAWKVLAERLADAVGDYLVAQAEAGADALQLFDSWVGVLSPCDYERFALPYTRRAIERVKRQSDVPLILFGTGTCGFLSRLRETGCDVVGLDWRVELSDAWTRVGRDLAAQGNLDPVVLLAPPEEIRRQAAGILNSVAGVPGHIFNLGHGVLEPTPVDHVRLLVDFVHEYSARIRNGASVPGDR